MPDSKLLRIGQLAKLTDKTARALHLYEEMDLLCPVGRTPGGFRVYDESNVTRIRYIDRLQRLGYSLRDIRELVGRVIIGAVGREGLWKVAIGVTRIEAGDRVICICNSEDLGHLQTLFLA